MGKGRKKPATPPESPQAEDYMGSLAILEGVSNNEWLAPRGPAGWAPPGTILEEDEEVSYYDDDDDDDEEEEEEEEEDNHEYGKQYSRQNVGKQYQQSQSSKGQPTQKGGNQGKKSYSGPQHGQQNQKQQKKQQQYQQQQHQQQQQQQRRQNQQQQNQQYQNSEYQNQQYQNQQHNQHNQNQKKKSQKNPKSQNGQKVQNQQQETHNMSRDRGVRDAEFNGSGVGSNYGGGGGSDWGATTNAIQQQRLASLLNQVAGEREQRRGLTQQYQGQAPTPAERVKAAAYTTAPSRTLAYAASNSATSVLDGGARGGPHATVQIIESGGVALQGAQKALFSHQRLARHRIHWMFSPTKDDRVATLLHWIQSMSYGLATLGLYKFLQTGQRGALVTNADFRSLKFSNAPAFDWLTFDDIVETYDKTLQESMAFYEPDFQVLVFVFLLSRSGNSLAMWRRKLPIPTPVLNQNREEIAKLVKTLAKRKYVVTVDEFPPTQPKPKKKWLGMTVRW